MGVHEVFISHVEADADCVAALKDLLVAFGLRAYSRDLDENAQAPLLTAIAPAIAESRVAVLVLSAATGEPYDVVHEIQYATELGLPIVVLQRGRPALPGSIRFISTKKVLRTDRPCAYRLMKFLGAKGLPLQTESKAAGTRAMRDFDAVVTGRRHRRRLALIAALGLVVAVTAAWAASTRRPDPTDPPSSPPLAAVAAPGPRPAPEPSAPTASPGAPEAAARAASTASPPPVTAASANDPAPARSIPWSPLQQDPRLKALARHYHAIVRRDFDAFYDTFAEPMERLFLVDPCTETSCDRGRFEKDFRKVFAEDGGVHARITPIRYAFFEGRAEVRVWKRTNLHEGGRDTHFCTCDVYRLRNDDGQWRISAWYNDPNDRDKTCTKSEAWCFAGASR